MDTDSSASTYQNIKHISFFVGLLLDIAVLLLLFFSGATFLLKQHLLNFSANLFIVNGLYIFFFSLIMYVVHFPLNFYIGFILEHKFQLSNQTAGAWMIDDLKKTLLGFFVGIISIEAIYVFLGRFPETWWIFAGIFWLFLSFVLAKLTPNVIIPLFYKYSLLENQELRDRIKQLFQTCRVSLKDVYAINFSAKTKKANAFLCGMGKNRRVVLSDTLLSNFSTDEIEAVVAHELGHYHNRDIFKMLMVNALMIFVGLFLVHQFLQWALVHFGLSAIDDIAFFPIVALGLMFFSLLMTPLLNAFSCWIERQADQFSLEKTQRPQDFISMMKKLGEMNLAEWQPSRLVEIFFYDHPPIAKRIAFAQNWKLKNE